MAENEQRSIIGSIEENRRLKALKEKSVETAKDNSPTFRKRLQNLILTHVPAPEIIVESWESLEKHRHSFINNERTNEFPNNLKALIKSDSGDIEVNIGASSYPQPESEFNNNDRISYVINVSELDHYLKIDNGQSIIESKSIKSDAPRDVNNLVIGRRYNTWPSWKREVTQEELDLYNGLLDVLEQGNVEFSGSTPPKKVLDRSTVPQPKISRTPRNRQSK